MPTFTFELPPVARYQQEAIFCEHPKVAIEATTKSGKTLGCMLWLLQMAGKLGAPGREFWWVAPVFPQADIAYNRTINQVLRPADPHGSAWTTNKSERTITLYNGAVLRYKTGEKPDNLYGEDVWAAVLDEASRMREEAWWAMRSTLTATSGPVRLIGNVRGRNNWFYRIARRGEGGDPEWKYAKITADDAVRAGILTRKQVEDAKGDLPEQVFRELYYAEPSDDGGNPFGLQHIAACTIDDLAAGEPVAFGVDLAKSQDWTVVVGLNDAGGVCYFDRWQRVPWRVTTERIAAALGQTPALVDSTGVGDPIVEELRVKCGGVQGYHFTSQSKQQLMEGLAVGIQGHKLTIPNGVMARELESFEFDMTRTAVRYSAPEGLHDDCVCALALAWMCLARRPSVHFASALAGADKGVDLPRNINDRFHQLRRTDPDWGFDE